MAQQDDNIKKLYDELQSTYDVGSEDDFRNYLNNAEHRKALYNELKNDYDIQDEKAFDDYLGYGNEGKAQGTTKVGSAAQQVVNEYDQSVRDNAEAEEDLSAATAGAKIGGNISLTPVKANNQQTAQPAVLSTAKSVMDASGTPVEQAKATGPKTQFVSEDPNYVSGTPKEEALKKYPWMQPDQVYIWNRTTKEPVLTYVDENGQAVTDEDLQIKKAKSEITGQEDTEYMHPEAAALQLPNGNTRGVRLKKGALTQMADEIMRKEYGDNYLNTQFGRDGNVYTGAERRDLGAQQLYDELNSDVRNARISFAVADEKDRNEILSRIKAKWGKVADETSLVNAVSDENAAKEDIDIVAQQNINDLNAEIQNISRQMDQRGAEIDNASSPFVDQTFNARDVDAKYRLLQSKLNYAQNALKSWENVKNSGSLDALAGFKDAVMDISAWDFGFSDLKNAVSLLTAKGKDKQELVNLYGRSAEAAKFEDKYNPDSYRYGKIAGTSIPYALQFAGTDGGFKSIGSALSKKATSIAEKYALEGLKKQVVKGLGVAVGDIARAYTMSGTVQGLNTISDILTRSAGELTVDKQGNYQLKSDEPLLESIYKGVTASAIQNFTEMVGESVNISANLMRMLPKIGLGRVSNAITKIGTQDWYRVCNNWLSRAGVNDFGGEVLEEELSIILNAAFVGDNPLLNGSGGLLDVRTQKDILGGMLYSISAMRAGALAMYGVKKGVGSAFVKTLDMYDKMQLNQSDKGGQSIFGEGWTEIKDEIDNTPNDKVNAVIEKLAKEHPSKDEQSAIIDYAVKLLKTRGHNLGIAMASDGENDEGAQEEIKDMPDLSQPNAEYLNKDDGMIHKASLYPDASDPTGTAKDVFIIKGNLVTNEDGSINKDASDDTIIYIDGNGERHIASPDKFAAAYPPMSNNEVLQANEGGENEEAQTTTFNKGDEVNINVDGNNYTATIQGTDGFGNYNVYYEDEIGMMHPAKFTADQLNEMNGKSTVSNGQQATSEQPADVQQQVEQPVVEQPAQQEQETQLAQQAQEEQKSAIPKDEKGNALYHQVPVETTINDLYDGKLDDNEIRDFVDANISEADKNLEKINKKAPKIGINKAEYLKKKQEWQKQVEDATRISDYWNSVKDYIAKQTHTTPEEVKAAQDELSGEAARREYQDMGGSVQQDAVSVASDFIRGAKITPESFKAETGYGTDEQRKFVGMIAKAEKGGKTIDRLAEELVSYDNAEMNGVLFGGDTSSAKDAILSALQGAGTRGELKQTNEAEEQAYIDARNAARDEQYMEQYGMTYEEYLAYEEQIMPTIWREYNNYDETAFNNMYAEEIEQLLKSRENDTTGEEQADDRGNQVLSEQQVNEQPGSEGSQEQRTEAPVGVQGNNENAVAPEETQQAVAQSESDDDTSDIKGNTTTLKYSVGNEEFERIVYAKKVDINNLNVRDKFIGPNGEIVEIEKRVGDGIYLAYSPEKGKLVIGDKFGLTYSELYNEHKKVYIPVDFNNLKKIQNDDSESDAISEKIANAEAETDTNPTEGQKEAGNYKKGHVRIDGYDITIEQPKGSVRRGTDADGKQWEQTMNNTYGYIRGTEGVDGDHIDIFLSDNPTEGNVYVVDQVNTDGSFDEHKVMYGFQSAEDARAAYLSNYEEGWKGLGTITEVSKDEFKKWVNSSRRKTKPFAEYKSVKADGSNGSNESDGRNESNASKEDGGGVRLRLGENGAKPLSAEETAIRDAVVGRLRESGLEVITDAEEGQRVLDEANGKRESRKRKSANNTALPKDESSFKGTVILFTDTANIRNNLETLASDYEKINNPSNKNVISELGRALNATHKGSGSQYVTIEAKNGNIVTIRLADHNVSVERMDNAGRDNAISIVISRKSNEGVQGEGKAHVVEYFYPDKSIRKAGGEAIASIARSLQQVLYSGEYKDTTGLVEVEEVNGETIREQRVYHGSGADFEAFDHSHMGEGEGGQVYGWGSYVTEVEGIGRMYAERMAAGAHSFASTKFPFTVEHESRDYLKRAFTDKRIRNFEKAREKAIKDCNSALSKAKKHKDDVFASFYKKCLQRITTISEDEYNNPQYRHLYTVEIPDDTGENYLDWSNEISEEQKNDILNSLSKLKNEAFDYDYFVEKLEDYEDNYNLTGEGLYKLLSRYGFDNNYKAASEALNDIGFTGISYPAEYRSGGREDGARNYVIFNEEDLKITDHVHFFRTPNGEAYGFTVGGRIYVDPRVATADTPIHEYAHLWASALRQGNPEEWRNVVGLMKGTPVWDEVRRRYPELTADDDIADEVLATYSGRRGAERLKAETRKAVDGKGVFEAAQAVTAMERVKEALRKFWNGVADFLHIHYTSAEEVADRVMSDLLEGRTLKDSKEHDDTANFAKKHNLNEKDVEDYADYIRRGNLNGASRAFKEIRRKVRLDNQGASLGQFAKIFSPIEKELYERFGNIDELRQQYVQRTLDERNAMEAARKKAEEEAEAERRRLQEFQNMSSEQLDAEYMKAVEANDEIRMRNLVNEAARRNGYGDTGSEYQGVGAWMAPGNPGYESDEVRRAAVANDAPDVNITDIANGYSQQPVDYFTNLHAYGTDTPHGRESAKAINNAIDEVKKGKNPMVKVYRAVPKSVKEGKLRNGDWVTPSRKYAEMHGDNRLEGDYRIIEQEVPASQLWWDGNDINEWGFDDGKGYAYRNTKNNRKLNDLITRDDKGNIIPLSQRFNARKADVRYRNTENQAATDNIEDVNKQFNQQLEGLTEENADKVTLSLGRPSAVLRAAGVEDKPMKLYGNKVIKKMRKHGFTLAEIKDLPRAVADPIAVFNNYQKNGNRSILTELQIGDKHILVSVTVGKTGVDADFNIVSSVFGKGSNNVVDWINKGYATFINKEKALDYLHFSERSISEASDNQELVSTANIIRNFENPNVLEENLVPTEQTNDIDTAVADTANKLNIGVRVAHSIDEVNNDSVRRAIEQGRRIQGFYDTRTGEIVVYAPNAVDAEDAVRTVLHEGVAHYGLRQLVGEENFGTFLDNIYNNVSDELKQQIDAKAREHNWSARVATEEYLASLAEDTNFEQARNSGIWQKIKDFFMDLLTKAGIRLNNALSDNELRYILWRSYENLKEPGRYRSIIGEVRDITKQRDLNVGNFAVQNTSEKVAENNNDEINRIVEEAKANGTYMKAPNGSDTNLNERQWAQVRTKAFKDWFGDWENDPENASKVIDENGEPKVVYHGSRSKSRINVFEEMYEKGTFFSTSKNVGSIYSSNNPDNLYSAFINAKNPLIVDNKGKDWNKIDAEDLIEAAEKMFNITKEEFLESLGEDRYITTDGIVAVISRLSEENKSPYDGLILKNVIETNDNEIATDVVAIKSNQIKSATDNTGAFSSDDDDIRYRFIGETGAKNLDAAEEATTRLDNLSVAREMENAYNEKKARIEKLKDSKPVDVKYNGEYDLNRKPAKDWLKENVRGEYTNNDTGEKIGISKVGINEVTSHGSKDKAHLKSLIAIPQMIEQSIFIDEIPNTKGHDKYDSYKYYVCGLKIDNVDYIVKLVVGVKGDNKYYDHRLTEIEKGTLIDNLNGLSNSVAENQNANISYGKDTKLQSILQTNDRENARKIKLATGWERGADGKWRYETADFEYHPKGDARQNDKYKESDWYKELYDLEEKLFNGETLTNGETKRFDELSARVNAIRDNDRNTERIYLDDYVEDNELFKAYPELKQTKIDFVDLPNEEYSAKYNEEENRITVNQAKSIDDKSAIAHEVQHAIQHIEGFAKGSNIDNYNSVPTSENVINDIIDATDGHILDGGGFDNTPEGIFNALNRKTTYGTILRDYSSELDDIANKYGYETIFDLVSDIDKFKSRVEMYLSEAGEVEARNVEARINMTPEERRQSLASETEDVAREDQLFIYDNLGVNARQGTGALTDSELSNANDPAGKMLGKPSRTPAQQKAFAERERQRMADRAREVADILHLDNVEIVTDASTLQGRRAKAKGFYSRDNGKIVIVVPNHVDMADIEQTVLHEAVAHYGLRKLFGSNFDTFLYNVYNNASQEVREKITQLAAKHNWDFATATEEYLASLAEKTNFEDLNASWWDKIKSLFLKLLHSIGLKGFTGVSLTDNELRYILWRSYENLKNPGRYRSIIDEVKDITMQNELRVGNYSAGNSEAVGKAAENGVVNIEDVNRRFNEELGRLTEENAQSVILNLGRPGNILLASGLSDRPIKLYGNKLLKKMRKHGFTTSDVKNLPKEINNPIAVFKGSVENSFAILTELEINGNNVLASISVGKGNDIDFNIISSVYGKNGNSVVSWINDGKILYVNKEKALNYLRISAPIAEAQDNQELSSAANIVKNFENPNISEENMRYGNGALAASESNGINKTNETNGQEAEEANRRFNEELNAFKAKTHKGLLHLGQPGRILNACGINEELTLSPTVLSRKLKQHGLNVDDIKGLAGAIQEPILVYQHGDAHPNMVIVTDLAAKGGKVSVAVELDGEGNVVELNNVSSVHSKGATTELERLSNMRDGYLEQALRWVDKNKVSDWLGIADLNSPIHANNPKLVSIANILQNFENPSVGEENILYREAKKVEKKINSDWRDEYDKKLSKFSFKLTEAAQDAMRSVKILQDIIAKETSAPIRDDENVYWRENRLSSVNKYEQEYYNENYCKPIVTEIANLVKYGARYNDKGEDIINSDKDVLKYLIAKSGLERNQSKREVEAMNARKPYEDQIKELQKQVEKEEIKEENANKKIAKLQEQADKAEMNKRVAVLHKDYSGLTELFQDEKDFDTLATSYVSDFEKKFDTESLWNAINRATKETLRKAFVDGLISRESYESTAKMYKYYIPLRGWANDVASEAYNYKGSGEGSRKILQTAKGRTSLADNPISEIGRMMQDAIFQGNRNRMKQAVYNLAMNHDTSLLNIKRQWYQNMGTEEDPAWERVFPDLNSDMTAEQVAEEVEEFESRMRELKKEGKATQSRKGLILRLHTTKREEAQHRISVAINGKEYNIFVNGNPRAAQAINGELNDVDRYGSAVAKVNRFLSQVYTSINPEFVVTNYQRDAGFAASIVASTEPWSYQKEWAKNMTVYNPITTGVYLNRLIKKAKTGNINPSNKAERYMQEFLSHGGETGFTNMLSADDYKKQIKRDIKSINSVVSLPKAARAAVAFTERVNTVFEDATRYATYVTSREQGRTIDRSIRDAKEISLNFNTRGADGLPGDGFIYRFFRGLRRWMIFVNPSIQGLNKAGMAFRNHPLRSSMMIAGLPTLLGYALPAIMRAVVGGGDGDDDDKNVVESYKDLPKWVRRTNIAIPIGGNNFVTIPLSYELRVSYGLGEMIWEYGEGMIDKDEIAVETLSQLSDLLPVSFSNGTVAQSISPSIARPLIDVIQNRNFYGKKIYNDSQFIEGYPEYMKAYAGTPKWLVKSTEVLNNVIPNLNAGVSDKYTPGAINVNPAIIDYLLSSYLGGLYNFPSKFGKTISMIWDEDMRDIQNVPIVSRNWKNSQSGNPYNSGDRYKTYMKEYDLSKQRFNGYKKEAEHDVPEFLKSLNDLLDTPSGKRMLMIDAYKRGGLDKLNQRIRDIDAYDNERYEGEKDALTKKRDEVKEELINKLDSISDGTLDFVNGEWVRK